MFTNIGKTNITDYHLLDNVIRLHLPYIISTESVFFVFLSFFYFFTNSYAFWKSFVFKIEGGRKISLPTMTLYFLSHLILTRLRGKTKNLYLVLSTTYMADDALVGDICLRLSFLLGVTKTHFLLDACIGIMIWR